MPDPHVRASTANVVCMDADIFGAKNVPLNILQCYNFSTNIFTTCTLCIMNVTLPRRIMAQF